MLYVRQLSDQQQKEKGLECEKVTKVMVVITFDLGAF